MGKGLIGFLYDISRTVGKVATALNDINTVASGDVNKIKKRAKRKVVNKLGYKLINKINKK